jgi:hypothetical protein
MATDTARRFSRLGLTLSEEQRMVADAARGFATRRLAPGAAERDRTGRFPREELGELAELGLLAMKVPTDERRTDHPHLRGHERDPAPGRGARSAASVVLGAEPRLTSRSRRLALDARRTPPLDREGREDSDMKVRADEKGWELLGDAPVVGDAATAAARAPTPTKVPASGIYPRVEGTPQADDALATEPAPPPDAAAETLSLPPPPRVPADFFVVVDEEDTQVT